MHSEIQSMHQQALQSMRNAHAPYSKFQVGCSVRSNKQIFSGCNVENAAFSISICAEVAALGNMVNSIGFQRVDTVVITSAQKHPCPPCGACRQALLEFGDAQTAIILCNAERMLAQYKLGELLPHTFTADIFTH
jgi:cytidine deaminase